MLQDNLSVDSGSPIDSKSFQYTPLLEQYENLFPNFKLHVDHIETFPPVFFEVDSVPFFVFEVNLPAGLGDFPPRFLTLGVSM
jgi:hypothetical protein